MARGRGGLQRRRAGDRRDLQRRAAHRPRHRRAARPRRPGAQRRARPAARRAPVPVAAVLLRPPAPAPRPHVPHAGLARRPRHVRQPDGQGDRPEGGRGADARLARPGPAGPAAGDARADRAVRGLRGPRAVLPLSQRAAEPDQLELRAVRLRGGRDRQPGAAARGLPPPHGAVRRRRAQAARQGRRAQPLAELPLHLPGRLHRARARTSTRPSTRTSRCTSWRSTSRRCRPGCGRCRRTTSRSCAPGPRACSTATGPTRAC